MKVLIITRDEPRHIFFANELCRQFNVTKVYVETTGGYWQKVLKTRSVVYALNFIYKRFKNCLFKVFKKEREFFFGFEGKSIFAHEDRVVRIASINAPGVRNQIASLQPDLIATFGCSVLKKDYMGIAPLGIINIHSGIVPWYRGVDCVFWSLYNNDLSRLGCSIHFINEKIDSGDILTLCYPQMSPTDSEQDLFNKVIRMGIEGMVRALKHSSSYGQLRGKSQEAKGCLYLERQRSFISDLNVALRRSLGLIKIPVRSARTEDYYL